MRFILCDLDVLFENIKNKKKICKIFSRLIFFSLSSIHRRWSHTLSLSTVGGTGKPIFQVQNAHKFIPIHWMNRKNSIWMVQIEAMSASDGSRQNGSCGVRKKINFLFRSLQNFQWENRSLLSDETESEREKERKNQHATFGLNLWSGASPRSGEVVERLCCCSL